MAEAPITAVNDFTSHALHHQVAEAALGAGKDLLTEKPMAVTVRAARRMCDLADANRCVLGVFQSGRYMPRTRHLRWLFDSGRCGQLQMVLIGGFGARWAPDQVVADTPWRHRRVEGGGLALDMGVHRFDLIRYLAGEVQNIQARTAIVEPVRFGHDEQGRPTRVECDAEDTVYSSFETANAVTGEMMASWAGRGGATVLGAGDVFYASKGRVTGEEVTLEDGSTVAVASLYDQYCEPARKAKDFPLGLTDTFALAQYEWLDAVRNRRAPETSGRDALRNLACAFAVLESAQVGRRVTIDEVVAGQLREYQRAVDEHYKIA